MYVIVYLLSSITSFHCILSIIHAIRVLILPSKSLSGVLRDGTPSGGLAAVVRLLYFFVRCSLPCGFHGIFLRKDLGALEWMGLGVPLKREETLLNVVARKPD